MLAIILGNAIRAGGSRPSPGSKHKEILMFEYLTQPSRFAWMLILLTVARTLGRGPHVSLEPGMNACLRRDIGLLPEDPRARDRLFITAEAQLGMVR